MLLFLQVRCNLKIILSRKGVDSGNCKASNLVLFNNLGQSEIIMIPIPNDDDKIAYKDIIFSRNYERDLYTKGYLKSFNINLSSYCHLDPNLANYYEDLKFLGSVGQVGSSQTHLENQRIKVGDIFIFFGRFEFQKISTDSVETIMKDKHVMFGYLQIGEIIYPNKLTKQERDFYEKKYPWITTQPHWNFEKYKDIENNCIYVARDKCSFDENIKGYGVFEFNENLILTKKGKSISQWKLPRPLRRLNISYHDKSNRKWNYFQSAVRGQEFVIEEKKKVEKWAVNLIKNYVNKGDI